MQLRFPKPFTLFTAGSLIALWVIIQRMPVPTYAIIYNDLALVYEKNHQIDLAIKNYRKAIYHNPQHPEAYYRLGAIYERQGNENEALEYFEKVTDLNAGGSQYARAYGITGLNYFRKKHYIKAIEYLRKSIFLNPELYGAYYYLGAAYYYIGYRGMALTQIESLTRIRQGSNIRSVAVKPWEDRLRDLVGAKLE